ncbi:hypothetical protein BaRGS_00026621 [Batillaria attramentaria]|uniref:Uncharacterized protein n=1 Tax=Batillaria attramentaria TaxID=370345 RepID=A0ABD0K5F3_9CAEN
MSQADLEKQNCECHLHDLESALARHLCQNREERGKMDLKSRKKSRFLWNSPAVNTDRLPQDPVKHFEPFFDDDVIQLVTDQSIAYAGFKGNRTYMMVTSDEILPWTSADLWLLQSTSGLRRF